jgi:hypothetical protein
LTSGAELALCPHAQQATHCAPSRTRRNPHACAQDMWHTHTFGIDAARERLHCPGDRRSFHLSWSVARVFRNFTGSHPTRGESAQACISKS